MPPPVDTKVNTQLLQELQTLIYGVSLHPPELPEGKTKQQVEDLIWKAAAEILPSPQLAQIKKDEDPLLALGVVLLEMSQEKVESMYGILQELLRVYDLHLAQQDQLAEKRKVAQPTAHELMLRHMGQLEKTFGQHQAPGPNYAAFFENVEPLLTQRLLTHPDSFPDFSNLVIRVIPPTEIPLLLSSLADDLTYFHPDLSGIKTVIAKSVAGLNLPLETSATLTNVLFVQSLAHPTFTAVEHLTVVQAVLPGITDSPQYVEKILASLPKLIPTPPSVSHQLAQASALDAAVTLAQDMSLPPAQTQEVADTLRQFLSVTPNSSVSPELIQIQLEKSSVAPEFLPLIAQTAYSAFSRTTILPDSVSQVYSSALASAQDQAVSLAQKLKLDEKQLTTTRAAIHTLLTTHPLATQEELQSAIVQAGIPLNTASALASSVHPAYISVFTPVQFSQTLSHLFTSSPISPSQQTQIINSLLPLVGTAPSSLPAKISQVITTATSVTVPPEFIDSLVRATQLYDPQAPQVLQQLRTPLYRYLRSTPLLDTASLPQTQDLNQVQAALTEAFKIVPSTYPEGAVLRVLQPLLAVQLATSPISTVRPLADLLNQVSSGKMTTSGFIATLAPVLPVILPLHPEINAFHELILSRLSQTNADPRLAEGAAQLFTLFKIYNPDASHEEISRFLNSTLIPRIESGKAIPDTSILVRDLTAHFTSSNFKLTKDALFIQNLTSHFIQLGITPQNAKKLAIAAKKEFLPAYYFTGLVDLQGLNAAQAQSRQSQVFSQLFQPAWHQFLSKYSKQISPTTQAQASQINLAGIVYGLFNQQYGTPAAVNPAYEFGSSGQSIHLRTYLNYISSYPQRYITGQVSRVLNKFFDTPYGQKFLSTKIGQLVHSRLQPYLAQAALESPSLLAKQLLPYQKYIVTGNKFLSPLKSLAKAAWQKFAATAIGKTVVSIGTKIAVKLGIKAILEAIGTALAGPIGTVIAFVVGLILDVLWAAVKKVFKKIEEYIGPIITFLIGMLGGGLAGFSFGGMLGTGFLGGLAGFGIQSVITGSGPGTATLSSAARTFSFFLTSIPLLIFETLLLPILIITLSIPIVLAFFLLIINSGAYVVPISPGSFFTVGVPGDEDDGSGGGGGGDDGGGGGFTDPSSCPIAGGVITYWSYNYSNDTGHGSTPYWLGSTPCKYSLPQSTGCKGPSLGPPTNVCYSQSSKCPYYGFALDVKAPGGGVADVILPLVDGASVNWNFVSSFQNGDPPGSAGNTARYTAGDVTIVLTHIAANFLRGSNLPSGTIIGSLYSMGFTHLHLEANIGGSWVKPEKYFCN